ncbi:MAG: UvrD-helicase domain-containing protein [bacterium]|nr:UvrD-helicase domain-containing protein [bacterium]
MTDYLDELNDRQKEAVLHKDGPLLIIAGAGAGKTKTITHRILHLIKNGVPPEKILAITFTNKAAKEMKDRVARLLGGNFSLSDLNFKLPHVSTFHSLGVRILRSEHLKLRLPKHFTIYDRDDSKKAIREAMKREGIDPKSLEPGKALSIISREKGDLVTSADYEKRASRSFLSDTISKIWRQYEKILESEKAVDFDDLLLKTAFLLKKDPEVRAKYQRMWQYVHIDEYQDTNEVQYQIVKIISAEHRNITVVGDIDQNIYAFRGASIKNILDFEKDYPDAKEVLLEENYRSTQTILTVANRIIEKNKERKKKNLFTRKEEGEKVTLYEAYDQNDEARFVATKAGEIINERGVPPKEIAVLYRANFQGRALEEAFLAAGVPYQVLGVRFFERKEIKDVIAYLRASLSSENLTDIKRIINVPTRGIGKVAMLKIFSGKDSELPPKTKDVYFRFKQTLSGIKEKAFKEPLSQTVKFIMKESGLEEEYRDRAKTRGYGSEEGAEKLENMRELVTYATKYDNLKPEEAVEKFLTETALQSDQDELKEELNAVRLCTVHSSKGLEFDYVFVTGLEDGLFPHKGFSEEGELSGKRAEEERRLFYVGITRARAKIYLSCASTRAIYGSIQVNVPSEFIFDIDEEFIEREERFEGGGKTIYLD